MAKKWPYAGHDRNDPIQREAARIARQLRRKTVKIKPKP